jgi:MerR family transcriptional regulator, copper efflux regulator
VKIQELAQQTGLTAYTIRFYEKEGLLDRRHVRREANNYRNYSDEAIERLKLVKKFQGVGCSLAELKNVLQDHDTQARTNREVMDWICHKIREVEGRKDELEQMLATLHRMLDYRRTLMNDPQEVTAL